MRRLFAMFVFLLSSSISQGADNWPQFRGPLGDGHSDSQKLALTWDGQQNVVWKTPIHDRGWSSPVVWKDQIWLTTATADGHKCYAVCVDRASGRVIHDLHLFDVETPQPIAAMNSYASPTSVIEEGRVYVHFGTYGTACIQTESGEVLWTRRDLNCDHHEGAGSSPMLVDNLLIFNVDGRDVQYVVALDKFTGSTVWKTDRSADFQDVRPDLRKCYGTPIVVESEGQRQLVSVGARGTMAYDIGTGKELWKVTYGGWSIAPRPVYGHGMVYLINAYINPELWAVKLGGAGDITETHIAWKHTKTMPSRPSPLLVDDLLYLISSDGVATCLEATSGKVVWQERISGKFSASPLYARGRVYFFDENSVTTVIESGRHFSKLAVNVMDNEELMATPAVAGDSLYVRTATHLYRIDESQ
ncbi:outer membrane protein assembly factor BamB family protein [Schlesneria sp.]|uniref:outer membrane protein assembly factor BamB family protein n=1 Tax=Schlesneria sp. TaxID=2762018 RepID=UPI002EDCF5FC